MQTWHTHTIKISLLPH